MGQRQLDRVSLHHFQVGGKLYHWDKNDRGKLQAHAGLGKDCDMFTEQQGLTE